MYSLCCAYRRRNRVRDYIAKRKRFRPSRLLQHLADRVRALPTVVGPAVDLTPTLMRKFPGREWVWQWMFPVRCITQIGLSRARLVVRSPYDSHERSSTMERSSCDIGPAAFRVRVWHQSDRRDPRAAAKAPRSQPFLLGAMPDPPMFEVSSKAKRRRRDRGRDHSPPI